MMIKDTSEKNNKIEFKLLIYFLYTVYLLSIFFIEQNVKNVFGVHLVMVVLFSFYYFGRDFLFILVSPIWIFLYPYQTIRTFLYTKKFVLNKPRKTVIILAHSNWRKLEAWIKPNFFISEIIILTKYLKLRGEEFSIYNKASLDDVKKIMSSKKVKEIYFYGHGSSHVFQLGTGEVLYYCEFSNGKYHKDIIHQMHCGTRDGKSLIDYVVPAENRSKCFLVRKSITGPMIVKDIKKKIRNIKRKK